MRQATYRKRIHRDELAGFFRSILEDGVPKERLCFLCIGTDRSTGDALGPLVGTFLAERGVRGVTGTLERPCDAANLAERLREIPPDAVVVAIDACLGLPSSVGAYQVADGPLAPGKSVGKRLPSVGDYSIAAIVNDARGRTYSVLQHTSLHVVMRMAKEIADSAAEALGTSCRGQ